MLVCFFVALGALLCCLAVQASLLVLLTLADFVGTWFHEGAERALGPSWILLANFLTVAPSSGRFRGLVGKRLEHDLGPDGIEDCVLTSSTSVSC